MSPTARTLKLLRKNGFTAEVVERFNHYTKRRIDFLGFVDIIAINGEQTVAIQATSAGNQSSRIKKILAEPLAKEWLNGGRRLYVHGWGRYKLKRGGKAIRWRCNEIEITREQFV